MVKNKERDDVRESIQMLEKILPRMVENLMQAHAVSPVKEDIAPLWQVLA